MGHDDGDWSKVRPEARAAYEAAVVEVFAEGFAGGFRDRTVWIVTAHNPGGTRLRDADNASRNEELRAELIRRSIAHCDAVGRDVADTWREASFALAGCGRAVALELARRWEQDAIFEVEPGTPPRVLPAGASGIP